MFFERTVTLTNGKQVKAYYLDQEGHDELWKIYNEFSNNAVRIENLQQDLDSLITILTPQIKAWLKKCFSDFIIESYADKSFREYEIIYDFRHLKGITSRIGKILHEIFEELVKQGLIQKRGSGWFRIA